MQPSGWEVSESDAIAGAAMALAATSLSSSSNPLLAAIDIDRDGHLFDTHAPINKEGPTTSDHSSSSSSIPVPSVRQPIPRALLPLLLSFLDVKFLARRVALTSRRGYASCFEYGQSLQAFWRNRQREDPHDDRTISEDEQLNFGRGTLPLSCFPRQLEMVDMKSSSVVAVRDMVDSRLSVLIVGVQLGRLLSHRELFLLHDRLPSLRGLSFRAFRPNHESDIKFPTGLRYCEIYFTPEVSLSFVRVLQKTCASSLNRFSFNQSQSWEGGGVQYDHSAILEFVKGFTNLRYFESISTDFTMMEPEILRQMPMLTHIKQPTLIASVEQVTRFYQEMTTAEPQTQTQTLQLRQCDIFYLGAMRTQLVEPMSRMSSSLTRLTPQRWRTSEVAWLKSFSSLRSLTIDCSTSHADGEEYRPPKFRENIEIKPDVLTETLQQLTQLQHLVIRNVDIDDQQLSCLMTTLTSLSEFTIWSRAITSIACLSASNHLACTLRMLELQIPIPPTEVVHLQSLTRLMTLIVVPPNTPPKSFFSKVPFAVVSSDEAKAFWQRFPLLNKFLPQK